MKHKILVVDDMPDVLVKVRHMLAERHEVHTATDGREALQLCQTSGPFALVLTDQGMPHMSGTEFLAHMRKGWPDTVRVMMTGYADLELAIEALHQGAISRFLQKPLRPRDLLDAVEAGLERFDRFNEERLLTEQLQFSRESLLSLTESLELSLASQLGRMRGLQLFAHELAQTESVEEVAAVAARATSRLLGGRATVVTLTLDGGGEVSRSIGSLATEVHAEPIRVGGEEGRDLGTIRVSERGDDSQRLSENDRGVLFSLTAITAVAANNQLALRALDLAHDATIFALESLAEYRDDETGKHLRRVSLYSELLARRLSEVGLHPDVLTEEYLHDLAVSAPLHDIGKVGIPDSILLKPGPLDEEEWEVMRRHTTIGAATIRRVLEKGPEQGFLHMGLDIALSHHEHWDGGGYPDGLVGEEIPLAARIVALADCYDALTTWRPYKRPWSHEETAEYLVERAGTQFDPDLVEAFQACVSEFDRIRVDLADTVEEVEAKRGAA